MSLDENKLASLFVGNSKFDELENAIDVFCPFEATGMIRQEIRHGHFLTYIFDPQRPHGFGADCLRALMSAVAKSEIQKAAKLNELDAHLMDYEGVIVRREWRNIDILIEVPGPKIIISIELKIDAKESKGQLATYKKLVEKEWPDHRKLFLFLTKRGDEASDSETWLSIQMEVLAQELERLLQRNSSEFAAKTMLTSYLGMLRRHHLTNERMDNLAASLWAKHREALEFLTERKPDEVRELFDRIYENREDISKSLSSKTGLTIVPDNSTHTFVRFGVEEWDEIEGMTSGYDWTESNRLVLIEIVRQEKLIFTKIQMGPGESEHRKRIFESLLEKNCVTGGKKNLPSEWKQLARKELIQVNDGGPLDSEKSYEEIIEKVMEFYAQHLPKYDAAIRPELVEG